MRFFTGGLNHAATMQVHNMNARTTGQCEACLAYLRARRAELAAKSARWR